MRKTVLLLGWATLIVAACATQSTPSAPSGVTLNGSAAAGIAEPNHNSAAHDDKGYIAGWVDGEEVELHYTKSYFCAEPPASGAGSNCEIGAPPEIEPRPGPIPTIYAIAAAGGIQPLATTLSCLAGTTCLNHPAMIDLSRIAGPGASNALPVSHSHVLSGRHAGWFNTVNIRVRDLGVWNQIAAAKSLAKVRELQADPVIGPAGQGLISADTPTNIYFFIASWKDSR
jgi:hypothetical protein